MDALPSGWSRRALVELQANKKWALNGGPFGSKLVQRDYVDSGVPVIRGVNLSGDAKFNDNDFVYVSERKADELRANNAQPGDVIFTQRGTLGQVGLIPKKSSGPRYVISQSQMKMTVDESQVLPEWIYYYFTAPLTVTELMNKAFSSGVPHINLGILRELQVPVPPLPIQRKIAAILSAYDDLIENNLWRIKILEEMAQNLYREWFVKFRFPDHQHAHFNNSSLGRIPEGWEVKNLLSVADVTYGFAFQSKQFNSDGNGLPVVRIRDVLEGTSDTFSPEETGKKYLVENGDILVGMDGDFHMGFWVGGQAYLVQRVARFRPKGEIGRYLLFLSLQEPIQHFDATITGTTVAHLGDKHIKTIEIKWPQTPLINQINNIFEPMLAQILNLRIKNTILRHTRDLLLPRLISGEVDVSELDIAVPEEAA
jgi:type I restriction enzyme S subunit